MSGIRLIHISQIKQSLKPRYLIDGLVPASDITVVWGKPKSGKTFIVLDMALHVAAGEPYRDRQVMEGPVVYCALEGATAFPDRIQAASQFMVCDLAEAPFWLSPDRFTFLKVSGANDVARSIESTLKEPPKLIVIDTLNRSLLGSENSDEDMTHYTRCIEDLSSQFSCAVMVIHHCGISGDKPRGHTSLTGTCAAQLRISRANKGPVPPGKPTMICTTVEFMKDGPEGQQIFSWLQPINLGINEQGQEVTSCYVSEAPEPADNVRAGAGMPSPTAKALAVLQSAISESSIRAITVDDWRERCKLIKMGKSKEAARRAFYRAMERLEESGAIYLDGPWVRLGPGPNGQTSREPDLEEIEP
jgi:AAA domain-containing protein